ncbi:hypothetical protein H6G35_29135 [Aulosira sp. FACHB-113]|nr:hypothetical protein [Aulosira sp. FACHB-113]
MNFARVGGLAATVRDAVATLYCLGIEVAASTRDSQEFTLLRSDTDENIKYESKAGLQSLIFGWCVNVWVVGRICAYSPYSRDFYSQRHGAISSLHSLFAFV